MGKIAESIGMTLSYLGQEAKDAVIGMMEKDLARYPERDVLVALDRCRKECRGKLAFADILDRLPNGHPGVEEAWAIELQFRNEAETVVRTDEMREASAVSFAIKNEVQARMAYKEIYESLMAERRRDRQPPAWTVSLGTHKPGIEQALKEAVAKGRISVQAAIKLLPVEYPHQDLLETATMLAERKAMP